MLGKKISFIVLVTTSLLAYTTHGSNQSRRLDCWVVKVSKPSLEALTGNSDLKAVILNQNYVKKTFKRDECSAYASKWTDITGRPTPVAENVVSRNNNKTVTLMCDIFSDYYLHQDSIKNLLVLPLFAYIVLTPEPYSPDPRYIAYNLTAHNSAGTNISNVSRKVNPCPPAQP